MNPISSAWVLNVIKAPSSIQPFTNYTRWLKFGSIKMDGFRNVALASSMCITPSLKFQVNTNIPRHFEEFFAFLTRHRLVADGELWSPDLPFNQLSSRVRSTAGDLTGVGFYIFDLLTENEWLHGESATYMMRYARLHQLREQFPNVYVVDQYPLQNVKEAQDFYQRQIDLGHEGIMLRDPYAHYKHGRCTHDEEDLLKFKNFVTEDAMILGCNEADRLVSDAEVRFSPSGLMLRSSKASDYEPADTLGSFTVTTDNGKTNFKVALGHIDHSMRKQLWQNRHTLVGQWIEFTHLAVGAKDVPRHGKFVRFRDAK